MRHPDFRSYEPGTVDRSARQLMIMGSGALLLVLFMPLLFWFDSRAWGNLDPPGCDSAPVLAGLRSHVALPVEPPLEQVIRDIQSVAADRRMGHRICYALYGDGDSARQIKYAVRQVGEGANVQIEVVAD